MDLGKWKRLRRFGVGGYELFGSEEYSKHCWPF
jgi:hypothetical protein